MYESLAYDNNFASGLRFNGPIKTSYHGYDIRDDVSSTVPRWFLYNCIWCME